MKYALCSLLLIYYFFTSGICYELFTPSVINRVESPYNIGLSAERTGVSDIASKDDIQALNWLKQNAQGRKIVGDYNSYCLVHGFLQNHVNFGRYGSLTDIKSGDIIFLSSWNTRNNSFIEPNGVGTREKYELMGILEKQEYQILFMKGHDDIGYAMVLLADSIFSKDYHQITYRGIKDIIYHTNDFNWIGKGVQIFGTLYRGEFDTLYKLSCSGYSVDVSYLPNSELCGKDVLVSGIYEGNGFIVAYKIMTYEEYASKAQIWDK